MPYPCCCCKPEVDWFDDFDRDTLSQCYWLRRFISGVNSYRRPTSSDITSEVFIRLVRTLMDQALDTKTYCVNSSFMTMKTLQSKSQASSAANPKAQAMKAPFGCSIKRLHFAWSKHRQQQGLSQLPHQPDQAT